MDVSIAVSLIRGQMGAVVERAVNGAVETVLAEMLKVVGVKFEELKAQLAHMKRDVATLQREKALKEKENDNVRAKLRYTELKLKYYRQGVEEELQHRASSTSVVRSHQTKCSPEQAAGASVSSTGASPSCSSQTSTATAEDPPTSNQESPQYINQHCISSCGQSDVEVVSCEPTDCVLAVSVPMSTECLENSALLCHTDQDVALRTGDGDQEGNWNATVHPCMDGTDTIMSPPPLPTHDADQQSATSRPSPHGSQQADSSTLAISTTQVKMEEEDHQVICIKGEPEEEQEVMSCLLLDSQMNRNHLVQSEVAMSATEWSGLQASQRKCSSGFSSAGPSSSYATPQTAFPAIAPLPPGTARQMMHDPWTKDFRLYEEYKMRRNELRRRSLNRRRELEKTLPQPLLADLVSTGAARKDQTEGGQMAGKEETAGLSQPSSDTRWRSGSFPGWFPHQWSSPTQSTLCVHFRSSQQRGHLCDHHLPLRHAAIVVFPVSEGPQYGRPGQSACVVIAAFCFLPAGQPNTAEHVFDGRQCRLMRIQAGLPLFSWHWHHCCKFFLHSLPSTPDKQNCTD
ncbi:uncharacterized protein si:ch211-67e16.4 isoform X1 [Phycodurus eques]|uniref:uncharacterized protein si:ch211-67e16.4 isoform X1 n=1 Tax=Phycodurus eques TaxID=693459 RepID=UPI002ACE23BD|nr:uncharacterized protein si:ch211-67e16.4 isoform X1 [Phycodurus eques]